MAPAHPPMSVSLHHGFVGFRLAPLPRSPVPLPHVPGPKLAPFTPNARADIESVEFLGRENDVDSKVWKVKINGFGPGSINSDSDSECPPYLYFCHSDSLRDGQVGDLTRPLANPQLYVHYFDPFNCECRAYGRLTKIKCEDLAVMACSYLLTPQQETDLTRKVTGELSPLPHTNAGKLNGDNFWRRPEQHRGLPVRAIVKELVSRKAPNSDQAQGMWADLQALHSLGMFVRDTHGGNYPGKKLVDFSRSWTMCYPAMVQIHDSTLQGLMFDELQHLLDH
ncbi:hypothetical protein VTI74DRAFT_1871 [Chaetomium olivicolor]